MAAMIRRGFREPHEALATPDRDVAVALARAADGPQPRDHDEKLTKYRNCAPLTVQIQ